MIAIIQRLNVAISWAHSYITNSFQFFAVFLSEVVVVGLDFGAVGERQTRPKSETATAKSAATAAGGAARSLVFVYVCTVKVGVFTKEVAFLSIT